MLKGIVLGFDSRRGGFGGGAYYFASGMAPVATAEYNRCTMSACRVTKGNPGKVQRGHL